MGRTSDKDVQAAFVEFRAKEDDKVGRITSEPDAGSPSTCSAFPSNVSTVSKSAPRTRVGSARIYSNVMPTSMP